MLFHFLGFAFLEYCLFSLVCASPMKDYLKIEDEASAFSSSSSSSSANGHRYRYSPFQKQQNSDQGIFQCPDGQMMDVKTILNLAANICHNTINELQKKKFLANQISSGNKFDTMVYPIDSNGKLVHQSASKDPSTGYEVVVHQYKQAPQKCLFNGLTFKSGSQRQFCPYTPQRISPLDSSIFKEKGKKVFDCNGVLFHSHQVQLSMLAAKIILIERFSVPQLAPNPKSKEGFPYPFQSVIFAAEDTWIFPILPGKKFLYTEGDPGIYSVIITGTGKPVGVVYLKTEAQYSKGTMGKGPWTSTPDMYKYGVCKVKDLTSFD